MSSTDKVIANPMVVFREEFDDWAVRFDLDTGHSFGLNPVEVFIWKRLDGKHTTADILSELRENCQQVPEEAENHLREFIDDLIRNGLVGYEFQE